MSKKRKKNVESLNSYDPAINKLAMERFLSGKQIFNYKTKRLHDYIRDPIQARGVLLEAQDLAKSKGGTLRLSSLEKRLLQRALKYTELLALALSFCTLWALTDMDNDGSDPDLNASLCHELQPDVLQS